MTEERTVTLEGQAFKVYTESTADGGWSAHTREPEVVGGLGDTLEGAIADWQAAMTSWLEYQADKRNKGSKQ